MSLIDPSASAAWSLSRWTAAAYCSIGTALAFVLGMSVFGVLHDLSLVRSTMIQSEMGRIRSHAARTVAIIQDQLSQHGAASDLMTLRQHGNYDFLRRHWAHVIPNDESRLYAAVVSADGKVVAHSNSGQEAKRFGGAWYDRIELAGGDDVVETRNGALTAGKRALDASVPIFIGEREVGAYHSGLNYDWLEQELAQKQGRTWTMWGLILSTTVLVMLAAGISLFHITRRMTVITEAVKVARVRRFAEMGQLMSGIVHEIRNPLNAMRLNLHVLKRFERQWAQPHLSGEHEATTGDPSEIIAETNREIERVEGLMRILLGYARPDRPSHENIDLRQELQATLSFLQPALERADVAMRVQFPPAPAITFLDRDRFRQIVLNLINNAKDAVGAGGTIDIAVQRKHGVVELIVADNGPGVPAPDRERIFEPFFTTKELGTGIGLALVRRFVEEVGGTIVCESNAPCGALFRLSLLEATPGTPALPEAQFIPT